MEIKRLVWFRLASQIGLAKGPYILRGCSNEGEKMNGEGVFGVGPIGGSG